MRVFRSDLTIPHHLRELQRLQRQHLYFCTSKASKLGGANSPPSASANSAPNSGPVFTAPARYAGTQFTCFTGTKVQILTPAALWRHIRDYSVYLLYWY
jgi:hypothetical protein